MSVRGVIKPDLIFVPSLDYLNSFVTRGWVENRGNDKV